jgi:hypothetical protein
MSNACSALRDGRCTNGFPVAAVCSHTEMIDYSDKRNGYHVFPAVPMCLDEMNCARLVRAGVIPESGRPEMGKGAAP